jgi:hypothetical protein
MLGDLFSGIGSGVAGIYKGMEGRKDAETARKNAQQAQTDYYADLDLQRETAAGGKYDPTYRSQLIGPYQRSQSPLARAYLESLLTGDNPQAAKTPWAGSTSPDTQFDARYGGYDALLDRGAEQRSQTPWATKTPGPVDTSQLSTLADHNQSWGTGTAWEEDVNHGRDPGKSRK